MKLKGSLGNVLIFIIDNPSGALGNNMSIPRQKEKQENNHQVWGEISVHPIHSQYYDASKDLIWKDRCLSSISTLLTTLSYSQKHSHQLHVHGRWQYRLWPGQVSLPPLTTYRLLQGDTTIQEDILETPTVTFSWQRILPPGSYRLEVTGRTRQQKEDSRQWCLVPTLGTGFEGGTYLGGVVEPFVNPPSSTPIPIPLIQNRTQNHLYHNKINCY